jgi:hypothetical protein
MNLHVSPSPQRVTFFEGESRWSTENAFLPLESSLRSLAPALGRFLGVASRLTQSTWRLLSEAEKRSTTDNVHAFICGDRSLPPEGYRLCLGPNGISLFSRDWKGAFYGLQTLEQLLRQCPASYPHLEIEDFPALAERGYMLDCSRCRVPTIAALERLIEELAGLKYNRLQLYLEHTFAFPGHETVWGDSSPLNAEEIVYLDQFAAEHAIELVPNFNTFGHFERWLRHPEYFVYAECPYGWRRADGHGMPWSSTLTPSPQSLELLRSLFRDYLPQFRSRSFNLGGDEPWELGMGRSQQRVAKEGKHAVYGQFLNEIAKAAGEHKDSFQFWADIVLESPEIANQLDARFTALVWEYEANADLNAKVRAFAEREIPFQICPGTSTWNALGMRLENARANLHAAGLQAQKGGAGGLLVTDWGDYGHHQAAALSLPALVCGAEAAWHPQDAPSDEALAFALSRLLKRPFSEAEADVVLELGKLNDTFNFRPPNRAALVNCLTIPQNDLSEASALLTSEEVSGVHRRLGDLAAKLQGDTSEVAPRGNDLLLMIDLLVHACDRIRAQRKLDDALSCAALRGKMTALIGRFEQHWVRDSRIGGLHESSGHLRQALASYPSDPMKRPSWPPTARS